MNNEKEIEKIIKLVFPMYSDADWDKIIVDYNDVLENQYIKLIESLIIKEKNKMFYNLTSNMYLRKKRIFINFHGNTEL